MHAVCSHYACFQCQFHEASNPTDARKTAMLCNLIYINHVPVVLHPCLFCLHNSIFSPPSALSATIYLEQEGDRWLHVSFYCFKPKGLTVLNKNVNCTLNFHTYNRSGKLKRLSLR
eukprot:GHVL01034093.1.p1 GENE.GHVL01034093.1~~GHVL01034093.1.p1  ORF type:complete len:116 (+),score=5.55 GHVL01034093.1:127-474(+)